MEDAKKIAKKLRSYIYYSFTYKLFYINGAKFFEFCKKYPPTSEVSAKISDENPGDVVVSESEFKKFSLGNDVFELLVNCFKKI